MSLAPIARRVAAMPAPLNPSPSGKKVVDVSRLDEGPRTNPHPQPLSRRRGGARSEEAELLRAVADQHVLGLLIMIEHHLVVFAADARLLVAAERRMCGIGVVAIGPDAARLDRAAEAVAAIGVAAPHARAETVEGVIGDRERFLVGLERGHRDDRAKDLLLENAHLVVALEHGGLDGIAARILAFEHVALAANEDLGAFLPADVEVGQDLLHLLGGSLSADHGGGIKRAALRDG